MLRYIPTKKVNISAVSYLILHSFVLLYESSFGARISVCRLSGYRRFPSQDSGFYSFWTRDLLRGRFGFLGRFLFDMSHPGLHQAPLMSAD